MNALVDLLTSGWGPALAFATVLAGERARAMRRRPALARAMHELRRPLQALVLRSTGSNGSAADLDLALDALDALEREIEGAPTRPRIRALACRPLLEAAVARWAPSAAIAGSRVGLRWRAGSGWVLADPRRLAQALDNLIVNALEHGGPPVEVAATLCASGLRIAVCDRGALAARGLREPARPLDGLANSAGAGIARLGGGFIVRRAPRRGHGIEVVRMIAAEHGGRFALRHDDQGTVAVLELPMAERPRPGLEAARAA